MPSMTAREAFVRQELISWVKVRFNVRVDEEAIFGEVCRRIADGINQADHYHTFHRHVKENVFVCTVTGCHETEQRCSYCNDGYCLQEDVQRVELRTRPGGPWNGGYTWAGKKCREYLRGHWRYAKEAA